MHLFVLFLFDHSFSISVDNKEQDTPQITARLVFAPELIQEEPEKLEQQQIEEVAEEPQLELTEPQNPEQIADIADIVQESELSEPPIDVLPETQQQLPPIENTDIGQRRADLPPISSKEMLRKHLSSINSQHTQQMAENAATEYRRKRISPSFPAANVDPFQTEEEKLLEDAVVEVDCSSTVNKSVMAVAGLLGGMMKCSKPPPFQSFIDKRLNKEPTGKGN